MDPRARGFYNPINGNAIEDQPFSLLSDGDKFDIFEKRPNFSENPSTINVVPSSTVSSEEDLQDDIDSDGVLSYINKILMEEDMDDKSFMLQGSVNLRAEEKSFYDVIGQKYPPSPEQVPSFFYQNGETPSEFTCRDHCNGSNYSCFSCDCLEDPTRISTSQFNCLAACTGSELYNMSGSRYVDQNAENLGEFTCRDHTNGTSCSCTSRHHLVDPNGTSDPLIVCNELDQYKMRNNVYLLGGSESVWQFEKGVEDASKFLPSNNHTLIHFDGTPREDDREVAVKLEKREEGEYTPTGYRGRKSSHRDGDEDLENERISKQAAVFPDPTLRSEMFDTVLLCSMGDGEVALQAYRDLLRNKTDKKLLKKAQPKGPVKGRSSKKNEKKEVVDLRTLLMSCAQAIAADDRRTSTELLKQIRHHSSSFGDGAQRLAHCFADGLEARLAGTGSSIYKAFVSRRTIASDYLKAYHLYLASCPFRKISHLATNKTILEKSMKSQKIHVIDFGILYGFQWPTFIQRAAGRASGCPRVRITGIEFPQTGFRPASGVEETGRRLTDYARTFDVPFEYNAIAKNWDSIKIEDLKIEKDEYLVVNSLYRFKNLHDETVLKKSSRTIILELIRKINPNIFLLGTLNGSYGAPFFVTRFREALFHFSALFDMLETNVPREHHERMLIEREIFGKEAMNVIACEGWERIERPETYKQWQVRSLRAGFRQIPFSDGVMDRAMVTVRTKYHKDFLIDKDSKWLIQGWKGRISYALSCWVPA